MNKKYVLFKLAQYTSDHVFEQKKPSLKEQLTSKEVPLWKVKERMESNYYSPNKMWPEPKVDPKAYGDRLAARIAKAVQKPMTPHSDWTKDGILIDNVRLPNGSFGSPNPIKIGDK